MKPMSASAAPTGAGSSRLLPLPSLIFIAMFVLTVLHSTPAAWAAEEGHGVAEEASHGEASSLEDASHGEARGDLEDEVFRGEGDHEGGHHDTAPYAVLLPWFVEALGVIVFYIMTRYIHLVPYTAIMFIIGTLMGVGATLNDKAVGEGHQLTESIRLWFGINAEVVLLVFLPGLLFWDALNVNWFLFSVSIYQLLIMAFPMVLAGTALTACVGAFIFPYGWPFMLAMTFGSILAATDPVAVAALLNEVGAPPRLKMHVSGESMLNDGSAVVFFNVFKTQFLFSQGLVSGEEAFTVAEGFALFFRMSLGGTAVGLAFGIGLILLWYKLPNYLNNEENIVQVVASITIAYLAYYVSEMVCHMSGIVAVIACGITARAFGGGMINKPTLMENFWVLVEHLLNSMLFTLGGIHWGYVISGREYPFTGMDWGYLFVLYVMLQVIRFFIFFSHYPIISRIGLKTNWQETFFTSYGGLRGAVGIALALAVNNEVYSETESMLDEEGKHPSREFITKLFGMVGGVAFLTLVINGTSAGWVLKKLGLAKMTDAREEILNRFDDVIKKQGVEFMVVLLTESRFSMVDFAVISHHMPFLKSLTATELREAVHKHKESVASAFYKAPNLKNILPYLEDATDFKPTRHENRSFLLSTREAPSIPQGEDECAGHAHTEDPKLGGLVKEIRFAFLDLLKAAYIKQIWKGELDPRENGGFLVHVLEQSTEFASEVVSKGGPLHDWEAAHIESDEFTDHLEVRCRVLMDRIMHTINSCCSRNIDYERDSIIDGSPRARTETYRQLRTEVYKALAFIQAHRTAQERLESNFAGEAKFCEPVKIVINESEAQVKLAENLLLSYDEKDVRTLLSHLFCKILLHQFTHNLENLIETGVLKEKETHVYRDRIEAALRGIEYCSESTHPGQLTKRQLDETRGELSSDLSGVLKNMRNESVAVRQNLEAINENFKMNLLEIPEVDEDDAEPEQKVPKVSFDNEEKKAESPNQSLELRLKESPQKVGTNTDRSKV